MLSEVKLLVGVPQKGETSRAVQACNDYLRMGPRRSLQSLANRYSKLDKNLAPTVSLGTLLSWSAEFKWVERATTYDAALDAKKTRRAKKVLHSGLALTHERVDELKKLATFLIRQLYEQDIEGKYGNLWLKDAKQIGFGEFAERVDLVKFNAPLISELRGALDDLAKETGGRRQKVDVNMDEEDLDVAIDRELAELVRLEQGRIPGADTAEESGGTGAGGA